MVFQIANVTEVGMLYGVADVLQASQEGKSVLHHFINGLALSGPFEVLVGFYI